MINSSFLSVGSVYDPTTGLFKKSALSDINIAKVKKQEDIPFVTECLLTMERIYYYDRTKMLKSDWDTMEQIESLVRRFIE